MAALASAAGLKQRSFGSLLSVDDLSIEDVSSILQLTFRLERLPHAERSRLLAGRRPVSQLVRWTAPDVYRDLDRPLVQVRPQSGGVLGVSPVDHGDDATRPPTLEPCPRPSIRISRRSDLNPSTYPKSTKSSPEPPRP